MASTSALFSPAELNFAQVPLTHSAATAHPDDEVPLRPDGRTPLQYRDLVLETGVSQAQGALGSAKVSIEDAAGAGGGGTTEVYAGVRGEIETMNEGQDGGRIVVSVECAPTAAPSVKADLPIHLASLLASLFSPASLPPTLLSHLVVLPGSKAWTLYLDILILSSSGGNVSDLSIIAARSALAATRLPLTRSIGFDEAGVQSAGDGAGMTVDEGFSGLVKGGKAGVRAVDFELIDGGEQGVRLPGWEDLPVGITLNLINQLLHLDATVLEESATSSQLVASFLPSGAVCGITQLGEGEIEYARVLPLISEASKYALELMKGLNAKLKAA
ncbi:uncharacterized protein JCM10292_005169 [Rhodotorula paludigena]|uniref:uncharacterized protein n=1 Tax=Rhodotorula paludigena TaxID=86838 RepID=UPI00316B5799